MVDQLQLAGLARERTNMTTLAANVHSAEPSMAATDSFCWEPSAAGEGALTTTGAEQLHAVIQKHIDAHEIAGAVTAVAVRKQLVWFEAHGSRDGRTGAPMRRDDVFRMMSSTKPVVAVAVLMMLEAGKLSLEDPVSRFIPSFSNPKVAVAPPGATDAAQVTLIPASHEITVKDLLTHTSGLGTYEIDSRPGPGALVNRVARQPGDTLAEHVARLGTSALDFEPGTRWNYSPFDGFDVLLRIVEITSGMAGDAFLRERVFEPLDMRDTHFNLPPEKRARLLPLHARDGETWVDHPSILGDEPSPYVSGAGGLFSTARDFLHFELMLLNGGSLNGRRLLKPETVALMASRHVGTMFAEVFPPLTAGKAFGLSVAVVEDRALGNGRGAGAFGWGGAYGTETWADPELDVAAVLLVQRPGPGTVATAFQAALRTALQA